MILAGANPHPLLPALSRNLPALHEQLVGAGPTYESADFNAALALARKMLGDGAGTIYIFSDFQKSNWENVPELPAGTLCRLRPVTSEPINNVGLTSTRLVPEQPVVGENAEVICGVFNSTPLPRQQTVRLELGDFAQERQVSIPPFSTAEAAFTLTLPEEGVFAGQCRIEPDDLVEDNTRHLVVQTRKALKLLLMTDSEPADQASAAFFVAHALVPSAQSAPGLAIIRRHSQNTDRGALETSDVYLLVAPATPSGEAVEIISRRVQEGARLVVILDGQSAPALVPAAFNPPFQLLAPVRSDPPESLVPGPRKLFTESDPTDWANARFRRHFKTRLIDTRANDVILAYSDGSAALTLSTYGKGALVFANLPLTPDAGDFLGNPMFPATLYELLRALRRGGDASAPRLGSAWVFETEMPKPEPVTIQDPSGNRLTAQLLSSGRSSRFACPPAAIPGVYLARQDRTIVGGKAINTDAGESDTRPIALERLNAGTGASILVARNEEELLLNDKTRPLWPQFAAAAACLLGLEMLLLALWRPRRTPAHPAPAAALGQTTASAGAGAEL